MYYASTTKYELIPVQSATAERLLHSGYSGSGGIFIICGFCMRPVNSRSTLFTPV